MKHFFLSTLIGGVAAVSAAAQARVGEPAPELRGTFTQLSENSLAELRGRVVLIEFWRTW